MNPEEKEALKQEIINEIEERFKGVVIREDVQGILSEVRDKWFRDSHPITGIRVASCLMLLVL